MQSASSSPSHSPQRSCAAWPNIVVPRQILTADDVQPQTNSTTSTEPTKNTTSTPADSDLDQQIRSSPNLGSSDEQLPSTTMLIERVTAPVASVQRNRPLPPTATLQESLIQTSPTDQAGGWKLVRPRRSPLEKSSPKPVPLKGANRIRRRVFYLGGIDAQCSSDDIIQYCRDRNVRVASCRLLPSKRFGTTSARLSVAEEDARASEILGKNFWPNLVSIRPWTVGLSRTIRNSSQNFTMTLTAKRQTFFALANARGILSPAQHSDFLILQSKSVDFIALTETHLDPTTPDNFLCDPSWHLFRRDRNRHGGGVALFSRTTFSCKPRPDLSSANGEDLWIETSISAKKVLLAVIYRPPNQSAAELRTFLDNLELSLTKALRSTYTVILLGDFNARCTQWLPSAPSNTAGIELYNILESFSLHQLVDVITRPQGGQGLPSTAGSILDLVITNNPDLFTTPTVLSPLGNSDHLTVHFSLPLRTSNASGPTRRLWSLNNGNIHAFLRDLSDQPWPVRGSNDTLDKQWNDWLTLFLSSARRHIPSKVIRKVQRKPPWLSDYLLAECKLKKQLFNLCKSCPTEKNRERFRCQRNKVTALLRRAKKCFSTNLEKELHSKNSKSFWNFIRSCRGRSSPPIPSLETPEGTLATTDAEKADILNSFFIKQSDLPNRSDATESALSYSTASPAKLTSITVLPEDVLNILLQLNVKKAPGPDGIPNSLLKVSAPAISVSLAALFNNSLSSGQLPSAWKSGIVKPIHKRGSRNLPDHYRPITLLSNVSKVLEKIVNRHLYDHLISNKLLSSFQSGFRKGDSPSYQLFRLTHDLMSAIDDGKSAGGIFFDVRKAFDSVWHKCLLDKLALAGVSDCVYSWLRDYLTTRQQRVQVGYQFSQSLSPLAGVPQGSVLGPTLFLLYIDSVTSASPSPTNCFADDTSTIVVSSSPALVEEQLQAAADAIHLWASAHKLSIHPEKNCLYVLPPLTSSVLSSPPSSQRPFYFSGPHS